MTGLSPRRMLAIIETQSEIASAGLALDEVMALVVSRAQAITGAAAAVVELIEGEEMVYHAVSGSAEGFRGVRLAVQTSLSGRCLLQGEVLYCRDAEGDPRVDLEATRRVGARSMLCVPLTHGARAVGNHRGRDGARGRLRADTSCELSRRVDRAAEPSGVRGAHVTGGLTHHTLRR